MDYFAVYLTLEEYVDVTAVWGRSRPSIEQSRIFAPSILA